jgi:arsenate reductase (thioredoxin)
MPFRVLFLCTGNSARSILFEATLNHLGRQRFVAQSAGSRPAGLVHPQTLAQLAHAGIATKGLRSKSWDEFAGDGAPPFDLVITVCDSAAQDPCPVLFGDFLRAHWSLPDPAATLGSDAQITAAFAAVHKIIGDRIAALVQLPVETMNRTELTEALDQIEARFPASLPAPPT